ncbi:MAG: DUF5666 domain-containing protein [Rhodocyclaceae bacterium]|nr:DUF5666 domain-containing protein [Rhodocyclaceae bacterium]
MRHVAILLAAWAFLLPTTVTSAGGVCAPPVGYELLAAGSSMGGIGGTGRAVSRSGGIGGTGRANDTAGAGGIGGTGIVGTITGFASICVNGLEVHYDADVPVSENSRPANTRGLAIGQIVAVEAGQSARGLEARRIAVLHALEGPVTRSIDQHDQFEVMGVAVVPGHERARDQARSLKTGDWVQVDGHLVSSNSVLASRVARIEATSEASVSGRADPIRQRIGGVAVDRAASGELTVRGIWDGQKLVIRASHPAPGTAWTQRPTQVVIETRVQQRAGNAIRTGRADVDAALANQRELGGDDRLSAGTLIRVTARLDDSGKLHPLRIERAPRDDAAKGKTESRGRVDEEDRVAKEAGKAQEKLEKERERTERNDRETIERSSRSERIDRVERPDRVDHSGRRDR